MDPSALTADAFYAERDRRTGQIVKDLAVLEQPVAIVVGEDAVECRAGQLAALALVNMVARVHRRVALALPPAPLLAQTLVPASDLLEAAVRTALAINPFLDLTTAEASPPDLPAVGIGIAVPTGLAVHLGAERSIATIGREPLPIDDTPSTVLGGGLAACFGAADLLLALAGTVMPPRRVSAWGPSEGSGASSGPADLGPVDVGDALVVGAGAVASGLLYWLREIGVAGSWFVIDGDLVELHNTNRCLGLLATDAGWPGEPAFKAERAAALVGANHAERWYDMWLRAAGDLRADLVLPLANERDVRHLIGSRGDQVLLEATTSQDWTAELHRHIADRDGCIDCRFDDLPKPSFTCSEGELPIPHAEGSTDAALPFLSAAAGLLLATGLIRLVHGELGVPDQNHWRLDFFSRHRVVQAIRRRCRDRCQATLPAQVRAVVNAGRRWAEIR